MSRPRRTELRPITSRRRGGWVAAAFASTLGAVVLLGLVVLTGPGPEVDPAPTPLPDLAIAADQDGQGADAATDQQVADVPIPLPLATTEIFLARDPFDPVVPEPTPTPPDDSPGNGNGQPGDPSTPSNGNGQPGDPSTPSNGTADPCTGVEELVCDGEVLTLLETRGTGVDRVAVIQVDDTRYEVGAGDTFGDGYQLVSFSEECVWIAVGDVTRRLCPDRALLK